MGFYYLIKRVYIYIYIYIYIERENRVVQKFLNLTLISELSNTSNIFMGFTSAETKTEICFSFCSFIRKVSVLLQEKC